MLFALVSFTATAGVLLSFLAAVLGLDQQSTVRWPNFMQFAQ
jgi:hypothetical protein